MLRVFEVMDPVTFDSARYDAERWGRQFAIYDPYAIRIAYGIAAEGGASVKLPKTTLERGVYFVAAEGVIDSFMLFNESEAHFVQFFDFMLVKDVARAMAFWTRYKGVESMITDRGRRSGVIATFPLTDDE